VPRGTADFFFIDLLLSVFTAPLRGAIYFF